MLQHPLNPIDKKVVKYTIMIYNPDFDTYKKQRAVHHLV